ncbi:hypothetical protein WN48_07898 [Eufriesea mexicana]|uniref:Uncharacterized protein n=1 Tax=Eufriesea mexicana TaxID=516756 RepID=A0A310SLD5_9HYME|nr:hypothetical protein WN48_07898 [Eufriesea mexicana]
MRFSSNSASLLKIAAIIDVEFISFKLMVFLKTSSTLSLMVRFTPDSPLTFSTSLLIFFPSFSTIHFFFCLPFPSGVKQFFLFFSEGLSIDKAGNDVAVLGL